MNPLRIMTPTSKLALPDLPFPPKMSLTFGNGSGKTMFPNTVKSINDRPEYSGIG
jgi:hypothetical protein